jgi:hypothetical protein
MLYIRFRSFALKTLPIALLLAIAFGCSGNRAKSPTSGRLQLPKNRQNLQFSSDSELIAWLGNRTDSKTEVIAFDSARHILPVAAPLEFEISGTGSNVQIEGSPNADGSFLAVVFDPSGLQFESAVDSSIGAITLILHPAPGVVLVGAAPLKALDAEVRFEIKLNSGKDMAARRISVAPRGAENSVTDLAVFDDAGNWALSWTERNVGDYSNDGEVAVSDITPIALNFQATVNHSDPNDHAAIVDGDGNNEVGVSDITPIAINYQNQVSGYAVLRFTAGGSWVEIAREERPALPDPNWRPPSYTYLDPAATSPDTYYCVRPYDLADDLGTPSVVIGVPGSNPALTPDPPEEVSPPDNTVNLAEFGVKSFEIPAGTTQTFDVVRDSAEANYIAAFISFGQPAATGDNVTIEEVTSGVSAAPKLPSVTTEEIPFEQNKLSVKLSQLEQKLLAETGTRPALSRNPATIGDIRQFKIVFGDPALNLETVDATVNAVLKGENESVRFWIDPQVDDGRISDSFAQDVADDVREVIRAQEAAAYGDIYDIDSDGFLDILATPWVNNLPGMVRGLFVSGDLQDTPASNLMDVVFVDIPDAEDPPDEFTPPSPIAPGFFDGTAPITRNDYSTSIRQVIAHELQHLINFSNRLRVRDSFGGDIISEEVWLNEALSHFTEDFVGYQGYFNMIGIGQFLDAAYAVPLIAPESLDNPQVRGAGYLFIRHIFEQYGQDALSKLVLSSTPSTAFAGQANIEQATGKPMESLLQGWLAALSFAGWQGSPPADFSYKQPTIHSVTGGLTGVNFLQNFVDYSGRTSRLPRPLTLRLDAEPLTMQLIPNAPLFVLINDSSAGTKRIAITAGSKPIIGVFARTADEIQVFESQSGSTPFEFNRYFAGTIESGDDQDVFTTNLSESGLMLLRVVAGHPGGLNPIVKVNSQSFSDSNSLPGVDLKVLSFPAGFGPVNLQVTGGGGSTGSYLISAEFYPDQQ